MVPDKELFIYKMLQQQQQNTPVFNRMGTLKPYFIFQRNREWSKHVKRCSDSWLLEKQKPKYHTMMSLLNHSSRRAVCRAERKGKQMLNCVASFANSSEVSQKAEHDWSHQLDVPLIGTHPPEAKEHTDSPRVACRMLIAAMQDALFLTLMSG